MVQIAGGVVYNPKLGIVVVNQNHNSWSLPKGHVEKGEQLLPAALREIWEETGIAQKKLRFISRVATYERDRILRGTNDKPQMREITLFFFTTKEEILSPIDPMNPEARWVAIDKVSTLLTHPKDKEMFDSLKEKIFA